MKVNEIPGSKLDTVSFPVSEKTSTDIIKLTGSLLFSVEEDCTKKASFVKTPNATLSAVGTPANRLSGISIVAVDSRTSVREFPSRLPSLFVATPKVRPAKLSGTTSCALIAMFG